MCSIGRHCATLQLDRKTEEHHRPKHGLDLSELALQANATYAAETFILLAQPSAMGHPGVTHANIHSGRRGYLLSARSAARLLIDPRR